MGNIEAHDFAPVRADERKVLNLGRKVSPKQYVKHLNGQPHDACLTELPWSIRDSVCLYEKMTIAFNAITEIPVELPLRLPHLSCLHLNHNQIASLPESFGLFFHLKEIQLQHNKLSSLPDSFVRLVKLEKVDLSYNELRVLHKDVGEMESLRMLNVTHNKLLELPASLGSPACIINILLAHQNRLERPSQAICDEGSQATLECLRKMHASIKPEIKPLPVNVFPRCCGNRRSESGVSNPHSAQIQYIQEQTNTLHTTNRIKAPLLPPPHASSHNPFVLQDKIIGLIYGAAIGDAIGISCQWMSDDEVLFHYGNEDEEIRYDDIVQDEHRVLWRQGDWTSNFDQFMLVLESLVAWGGVVDELEFARRLKAWATQGFPELGDSSGVLTSATMQQVLSHPSFTKEPHSSASRVLLENTTTTITTTSTTTTSADSNGNCSNDHNILSHSNGDDNNDVDDDTQHASPPLPPSSSPSPPATTSSPPHHHQHHRVRRLSSTSSSLPLLAMCGHAEVAQKLVYTAPSQCFGEDNSAVVRTAIIGVPSFHEPHEVEGNALRICRTTHASSKSIASCVAVSSTIALLLKGTNSESNGEDNNQASLARELEAIFHQAAHHLTSDPDREEFMALKERTDMASFSGTEPSKTSHCYKLVQVAVLALTWQDDFKSLISGLTRQGGDSSSNGCVAGAVMGCRTGYSRLPTQWLTSLRKKQVTWLNSRINHLLDIMGSP